MHKLDLTKPQSEQPMPIYVGGIPLDEWQRRRKLPIRELTPDDTWANNLSERLRTGLGVREDPLNNSAWVMSDDVEVGILKDGKVSWYRG